MDAKLCNLGLNKLNEHKLGENIFKYGPLDYNYSFSKLMDLKLERDLVVPT